MTTPKLRITGPDASAYLLGAPMHLYDGAMHVGTLDGFPVDRERTEAHIGRFTPTNIVSHQKLEIGKLALLEMVMFIVENFTSVQIISFSLSRDIEGYGGGMKLAGARSALLQSIGAANIVIAPKPDAVQMGHFVVSGVWEYNQVNLEALASVLQFERDAYGAREAAAAKERLARPDSWVRRLFPRPVSPPDTSESRL